MHLFAAANAFLAVCVVSATAAPRKRQFENATIKTFVAQIVSSTATTSKMDVNFKLDGDNANSLECAANDLVMWPSIVIHPCGGSMYSFAVFTSEDFLTFMVRVYHQIRPSVQYWGEETVSAHCSTAPNSDTLVCNHDGSTALRIDDSSAPTS